MDSQLSMMARGSSVLSVWLAGMSMEHQASYNIKSWDDGLHERRRDALLSSTIIEDHLFSKAMKTSSCSEVPVLVAVPIVVFKLASPFVHCLTNRYSGT